MESGELPPEPSVEGQEKTEEPSSNPLLEGGAERAQEIVAVLEDSLPRVRETAREFSSAQGEEDDQLTESVLRTAQGLEAPELGMYRTWLERDLAGSLDRWAGSRDGLPGQAPEALENPRRACSPRRQAALG